MAPRDRKDEIVDPKDDHLNSGDVRNLKWYSDNVEKAKKILPHADDLEEIAEARKWRNQTQKYIRAALVFIASLIAAVGGTIALLDKFRGPHP